MKPSRRSIGSGTRPVQDPEILTRIAQYEMAFQMQTSVPDLVDMSKEPPSVLEAYGAQAGRRIVRVELPAGAPAGRARRPLHPALSSRLGPPRAGEERNSVQSARRSTSPTAALINDLKQRGMLDDTLVICGGEFGRTPMSQAGDGRDHHIKGFSFLLAGGGIKRGITYGATDELGYAAVENPVSVHDFHATMLHLLGIDHKRLTVKYQGLDARLSGVGGQGRVVTDILA